MKHPTYNELQRYCDGDLPETYHVSVRSHLASCTACSGVVVQEHAMLRALQRSPHTAPGPGFEQRVMSQLSGQGFGIASDRKWFSRYAALLLGMAGTLAVVTFSMVVGKQQPDAQPSFFDNIAGWLAPLIDAVPLPSIRFGRFIVPEFGETIQLFAAVLGVLFLLAAIDRFVLQPLLRPHARGQHGIAPSTRGQ